MTDKSDSKIEAKTKEAASAQVKAAAAASTVSPTGPIVLDLRKNKKRRYSFGTKGLQQAAFGTFKASYRISNGVADGVKRFYKDSRESSRKRRDGLIVDFIENSASGFRDGASELAKAPYDLAKRINTRPFVRFLRNTLGG